MPKPKLKWPVKSRFGEVFPATVKTLRVSEFADLLSTVRAQGRTTGSAFDVLQIDLQSDGIALVRIMMRDRASPGPLRCAVAILRPDGAPLQFLVDLTEPEFDALEDASFAIVVAALGDALDRLPLHGANGQLPIKPSG